MLAFITLTQVSENLSDGSYTDSDCLMAVGQIKMVTKYIDEEPYGTAQSVIEDLDGDLILVSQSVEEISVAIHRTVMAGGGVHVKPHWGGSIGTVMS